MAAVHPIQKTSIYRFGILSIRGQVQNHEFPAHEAPTDIRVSGSLESHYSPSAKVVLDTYPTSGEGFIAIDSIQTPTGAIRLAAPSSIEGFARDLYSALRFADAQGLTKVCVIQPQGPGLAAAIRDRLKRAAN
jgi:L-threonylcarbamoyladenylate synthase